MPPTLGDRNLNIFAEPSTGAGVPKSASDSALSQAQSQLEGDDAVAQKQNQARASMALLPTLQHSAVAGVGSGLAGGLGSPGRRARRSMVRLSPCVMHVHQLDGVQSRKGWRAEADK